MTASEIQRFRDAARVYNELMRRTIGVDSDGDPVTAMTSMGGSALGSVAPVFVEAGWPDRKIKALASGPGSQAAEFIRTLAGWISQEGGDSEKPATSLYEQAVRPVVGMSKSGGLVKAWSAFGGAVLAMERQLTLTDDAIPAVEVLTALASALEIPGRME